MKELRLKAKSEELDTLLALIDEEVEAAGCPMKYQMKLDLAVEEIFVNIAHYAYEKEGAGDADISVETDPDGQKVTITFKDSGIPYNPLEHEDPDVTKPAEDRRIGGLGIYLVKKTMDDVKYEYLDGKNVLTILFSWSEAK